MYKIMIYLENHSIDDGLNLIEAARIIGSKKDEVKIYGVGINIEPEKCENKLDYLININDNTLKYDIKAISNKIKKIHEEYQFDAIIINANDTGRMVAPRVAMALRTGIVADVTDIKTEDDNVVMIRPAFDGKIMAGIVCDKNKVFVSSIRAGVFRYKNLEKKETTVIDYNFKNSKQSKLTVVSSIKKSKGKDIRESDFLISFGGGVNSDFDKIHHLGDLCGAMVSASRRAIDNNYAERSVQVGQSGKIVSPKVYIALGIYGSIQHAEGLKNVETIISVNTDEKAAICSMSDITVHGDAIEFVEKLTEKLEKERKNSITSAR